MKTLNQKLTEIAHEPQTNDIIKDLLPNSTASYMLICGRSGIGKTNLALYLAFCIATGTKFFSLETQTKKVGYLSFEGAQSQLAKRFLKLQKSFKSTDNLHWEHSLPIKLNPKGKDQLIRIIAGLEVVIIDPLRPLVMGDWMKPTDASLFLENLRLLQNETGTIIILIHHIRKPERRVRVLPEDLQFEIKGATEYVDGAASIMLLERSRFSKNSSGKFAVNNPDNRILYFPKVKDAPSEFPPLKLTFNRDELLFKPIIEEEIEEQEELI